ncbi:MAG: hypothetical protein ACKV22_06390 [Bryobacteraceae bacterium]
MAEVKDTKEYAGGWITERKGTGVPGFLKASYIVIASSTIVYLIVYLYGETNHSDRGTLVQQFNRVTQTSEVFMYAVAAMAAAFFAAMIAFAYKKPHDD